MSISVDRHRGESVVCAPTTPPERASTGAYWKKPYAALDVLGIRAKVVNAQHIKTVPGRRTNVGDAQWLVVGRVGKG